MAEFKVALRKIGDPEDRFDIEFWQSQGPEAIFRAADDMISDFLLLKTGNADRPQLDRTFGSFQKL